MENKALIVIDIQNDITKHYKDVIDNINAAVEWAQANNMHIVYIKHNNITNGTRSSHWLSHCNDRRISVSEQYTENIRYRMDIYKCTLSYYFLSVSLLRQIFRQKHRQMLPELRQEYGRRY